MSGEKKKSKRTIRKNRVHEKKGPVCGLCGATENLTRTECCGEWICKDEDQYVLFSYARNSCSRNHSRYTLCGHHWAEEHDGDWIDCKKCRDDFDGDLEMYVYNGTNEYNFKILQDPPKYQPTKCTGCGNVIVKSMGGYSRGPDGTFCSQCTFEKF